MTPRKGRTLSLVVVGLCLLLSATAGPALGAQVPEWAGKFLSPETMTVSYLNLPALCQWKLLETFGLDPTGSIEDFVYEGYEIPLENVQIRMNVGEQYTVTSPEAGGEKETRTRDFVLLRAADGKTFPQLTAAEGMAKRTHAGFEYIVQDPEGGYDCIARIDDRTLCSFFDEDDLKQVLTRVAGGGSGPLNAAMRGLLDIAKDYDHFATFVLSEEDKDDAPKGLQSLALAFTLADTCKAGGVMVFDNAQNAAPFAARSRKLQKDLADLGRQVAAEQAGEVKTVIEKMVATLEAGKIGVDGSKVTGYIEVPSALAADVHRNLEALMQVGAEKLEEIFDAFGEEVTQTEEKGKAVE